MERIRSRKVEYIGEFSLKRTRLHFKDVFYTRYFDLTINELLPCSEDLTVAIHGFYSKVEDLKWYLEHTQDMTAQVTEVVEARLRILDKLYSRLKLHLDAEID
jgi:hypothetical protein